MKVIAAIVILIAFALWWFGYQGAMRRVDLTAMVPAQMILGVLILQAFTIVQNIRRK